MTVYICGDCRFSFERAGAVDGCPDCGRSFIREATREEILEYQKNKAEIERELRVSANNPR